MNDLFDPIPREMEKSAVLSEDRLYRYELWRRWDDGPYAMFIGLNPSKADETLDDPTIRKCVGFAKKWGYGALCMTNLFAWRETSPKLMMTAPDPIGKENGIHLLESAENAGIVIAAWGKDGRHRSQDMVVRKLLEMASIKLCCLRKNGDGSPGHPLYIPYSAEPFAWTP